MSATSILTANALTAKVWSAKLFKEALRDMFFTKFMGESSDSIIQVKTDLKKEKGDQITIGLRMAMSGAGQSSSTTGTTIEGNEEALSFYSFAQTISEYSNGVLAESKLSLQRPAFDLRTEMKDALKDWVQNKLETLIAAALVASPTTNRKIDKTTSPTSALTVALIQQAKRKAVLASPKIRPVRVEGGDYYVMLVHPMAAKMLKADGDFKNAQLYANIRGKDNPIFTGALGVVDGVVLHEYDRSNLVLTALKNRAVLMGAQAGVVAWAQEPAWYEKNFDYGRKPGVATDFLVGIGKTVFNSEDFATITVDTTNTADS